LLSAVTPVFYNQLVVSSAIFHDKTDDSKSESASLSFLRW